jgi:MFS family permease
LLPLHVPVAVLVLALAWFGAATPLVNAPALGLLTARTPDALRAKVMTAVITVAMLAGPLGAAAAGPLIDSAGVRVVLACVAAIMTVASLAFAAVALVRGDAVAPSIVTEAG